MMRKTILPIMTVFQGAKQRKFTIAAAIAGMLLLILVILLLAGLISFSPGIRNAVVKGNRYYSEGSYNKALKAYKKGLSEKTEDPKLNFNAGQASYSLKNYRQAVSYYDKASETVDKYLNAGNSCYKQAENVQNPNQKIKLYQQALDLYHQGILKFPQEISLKYNYELVKSKIDEMKKNNQNKNDKDKDQQNKDKNKDKNKDRNDQQNQQKNQDKNGDGKDQQNKQDKSSNQNKSKEKDKKQSQDSEQQKNTQKQQKEGSKQDKKDNNKKTTGQESPINQDKTKASKSDKNSDEVTQVLQMLEKQEENSLKNNQEVKGKGKEDRYDW